MIDFTVLVFELWIIISRVVLQEHEAKRLGCKITNK